MSSLFSASSAPASQAGDESAADGSPCRVLVVDDNQDSADTLALLLELMGHEVRTANDGPTALEVAEGFGPEAVLLDIGLPRMDGYEVCRRMRQREWGRQCLVVALTGWSSPEDQQRARDAGFDRHLVKPVEEPLLRQVIAQRRR
jgi:CheY-like chemotaxis protein